MQVSWPTRRQAGRLSRGTTCDVAVLEHVLLRISALAEDEPHLAEMDCNPVVSASGAVVVDARVKVARAEPRRPLGARR
jgi:hypothetical protein